MYAGTLVAECLPFYQIGCQNKILASKLLQLLYHSLVGKQSIENILIVQSWISGLLLAEQLGTQPLIPAANILHQMLFCTSLMEMAFN